MPNKPVVGLVMKSLQADFFKEMKKGAQEFARTMESFELITVGTSNQTEIEGQIQLIEDMINKKVDALVVVPIDSKALVPVIVKAIKTGIKVINIDIRLDEVLLKEKGVNLTYVGPDNETASKIVGDVLARKLSKGSKVVLIEGLRVAENAQQRKQGFLKSIAEYELELVASVPADWETVKAESIFEKIYKENPDIKGVMCCNDAMAIGVINILKKSGKAGEIPVVGFDNDASVQSMLKTGVLLATIDAYGPQMAVNGIKYALSALGGMKNEGSYTTDFKLISP
jgi:ribose transport system substrate-binding protein